MRLRPNIVFAFILATVFVVGAPAQADILVNADFEMGTGSDADDWEEINMGPAGTGTVARSSIAPHGGSFSAHMAFDHINNTTAAGAYFFQQNLSALNIVNSKKYNLSFWARSENNDFTGTDMFVQIQWLDSDSSHGGGFKGEKLVQLIPLGLNDTYQQFALNDLDPSDGSDSYLLRFQVSAGAVDDIANGMFVDDAVLVLVSVPEPSTFGFLGFCGLLVTYRRRRSI